jgi:fructose-1,6-bisphosphatase/inositol monophosphatase family enzyme
MKYDRNGNPIKFSAEKEVKTENLFIKKLQKALSKQEVTLTDGSVVSNMDAIIDNLIGKAINGDRDSIKLIKELSGK